jgi:hypothetical protein
MEHSLFFLNCLLIGTCHKVRNHCTTSRLLLPHIGMFCNGFSPPIRVCPLRTPIGKRGSQAKQEGGGSFVMPFASVSCSRCSHFSPSHI